MNNTNRKDLTQGVVWQKLLLFFLPIAAGTCIQQLYNMVDGLIVGKFVGTVALAAVGGSSAQIINVLIGFFVSVTTGASVVIAQIYGAGRTEDVQRASSNALAICTLAGLVLTVFGLAASPALLQLLQTPADTMADSVLYLRIYFIGVPFILVLNMESNMLRAVGDSLSPFLYMVVGCISNIILDFVFVVFFHWGTAGVAVATLAAQVINMALLTRKLMTTPEGYRLSLRELRLHGRFLSNMLKLGIPSGLQSTMYSGSNMLIQVAVNSLGTVVVASWAMTSKTDGIFWAIINALGASITTFIGQNIGAGRIDRAKACLKQGFLLALAITIVVSALIMVSAIPLLGILTNDEAVITTTYVIMTYFVPYYFCWVPIEVLSAVMRGSGDATRPVIIIGLGICLLRVVWLATVFAWAGTLFSLCVVYIVSWVVTDIALLVHYLRSRCLDHASERLVHQ